MECHASRHFLSYSKADELADAEGSELGHWFSVQYKKVLRGDVVWLITMHEGRLYTIGFIEVEGVFGPEELEAAEFTWSDNPKSHGIFADRLNTAVAIRADLTPLAPQLRFRSATRDRLPEVIRPEHFQSMRQLTAESAALVDATWRARAREAGLVPPRVREKAEDELFAAAEAANAHDAEGRTEVLRAIMQRRGQSAFRCGLLGAYNFRCAVSDCEELTVLEAAHIHSFSAGGTCLVDNGLLLRADLHTLFDLFFLSIDPESMTVQVAREVTDGTYRALHGKSLRLPEHSEDQPNHDALVSHFQTFLARQKS